MQCQSQLLQNNANVSLGTKAAILKMNRAWFANKHPIECQEECMEPFPDIECMTIERFHNNYLNSKGDPQHRIVELGLWTVDLQLRIKFLTVEPGNMLMYRLVSRG